MPPEASSSGPTWVEDAGRFGPLFVLAVSCILAGCSSTSPRFTSATSAVHAADSLAAGRADTLSGSEGGDADAANDPSGKNASPDRGRRNSGRDAAGPEARIASPVSRSEENPAIDRHKVLNGIMNMMGSPYREGGSDTSGIDCSGFTAGIYRDAIGAEIPRACRDQFGAGEPVGEGRLKFGDLVFFNIDGRRLSHVGIYVGDGLFAHASVSLGITVSLLDAPYYKRWYAGARRILR